LPPNCEVSKLKAVFVTAELSVVRVAKLAVNP
jgi:hypothetical protein